MSRYSTNNDANRDSNDKFDTQGLYVHHRRSPSNFRGGHHPFDSPPLQPLNSGSVGGGGGGFRPIGGASGGGGGGGFRPMAGGFESNYQQPPPLPVQQTYTGQKRPFPFSGRGGEPPNRVVETLPNFLWDLYQRQPEKRIFDMYFNNMEM